MGIRLAVARVRAAVSPHAAETYFLCSEITSILPCRWRCRAPKLRLGSAEDVRFRAHPQDAGRGVSGGA